MFSLAVCCKSVTKNFGPFPAGRPKQVTFSLSAHIAWTRYEQGDEVCLHLDMPIVCFKYISMFEPYDLICFQDFEFCKSPISDVTDISGALNIPGADSSRSRQYYAEEY